MKFVSDRRGVAAMEMGLLAPFLAFGLMIPICDLATSALQYMGAYQALREVAAWAQYHLPPDVTNPTVGWTLPTIAGYTFQTTQVLCTAADGSTQSPCTSTNLGSPKSYIFSTQITLTPTIVTALAGTYTLTYSERFQ